MANSLVTSATAARPNLRIANSTSRLALIAGMLAAVAATFAYLGGWLTPGALTPARFTDAFEQVDGVHSGFRRNHAKGLGVAGFFESNGAGVRLSKAIVFRPGKVPVLGRFSLGVGNPYATDEPNTVRGLGLRFDLPDGEEWRTAMVNLPVFPLGTPEAFYERLVAAKPDPATGKPDPAKMKAFLAAHPETVQAISVIKSQPVASGFENSTFHGLNAFRFVNEASASVPVRWLLTPMQPFKEADVAQEHGDKSYLFDDLVRAMHRQPLHWRLVLIVGQPGDVTNDATIAWPEGRERIDVGTVTLDQVESDDTSPARVVNFDPLVLPAGIAPSDDPLLSARSAVYSQSFTRRVGEKMLPAAITPAEVRKGE